jgi:hypothetical protein
VLRAPIKYPLGLAVAADLLLAGFAPADVLLDAERVRGASQNACPARQQRNPSDVPGRDRAPGRTVSLVFRRRMSSPTKSHPDRHDRRPTPRRVRHHVLLQRPDGRFASGIGLRVIAKRILQQMRLPT